MFTGIIERTARVLAKESNNLVLGRPRGFGDLRRGSSVCVSGVCLTVVSARKSSLSFELTEETLRRTTLGSLRKGDRVNLERALPARGRFEGHIVQGHVEGVGEVLRVREEIPNHTSQRNSKSKVPNSKILVIAVPKPLLPFLIEKGSVAVDGVSLTVARRQGNRCTVILIPYTLKHTTLGPLRRGDRVNIETDILARHARQWIR